MEIWSFTILYCVAKKRSQKKIDRIKQEIYTIIWNKLNSNADLNELSVFGISSLITKPGFQDYLWFCAWTLEEPNAVLGWIYFQYLIGFLKMGTNSRLFQNVMSNVSVINSLRPSDAYMRQ